MSEPMSSVEIEDVLSSIRRLVSEDLRPAQGSAPSRPAETPVTPAPRPAPVSPAVAELAASKLILTPALRVVTDEAPAPQTSAPAPEAWDDGEVAAFVNVEDDAVLEDDTGWQTTADVVPLNRAEEAPVAELAAMAEPTPEVAAEPAAEAEPMAWDADARADFVAPEWHDALPEEAKAEAASVDEAADPAFDAVWADAAEAEVLRQLAEDGPMAQAAPSDDDMVYEENLLRDLVRDIIREELQGALGERITRNVRKLVRAEIARAVALRDFD